MSLGCVVNPEESQHEENNSTQQQKTGTFWTPIQHIHHCIHVVDVFRVTLYFDSHFRRSTNYKKLFNYTSSNLEY